MKLSEAIDNMLILLKENPNDDILWDQWRSLNHARKDVATAEFRLQKKTEETIEYIEKYRKNKE